MEDRTCLVTGSSKGIGRGIAEELGQRGANVVVNYRSSEAAAHTVRENIEEAGGEAIAVQADVAKMDDVRSIAADHDIACDTSTVLSHRSFEEIFTAAKRKDADLVVMEWGDEGVWKAARADRPLDDLTRQLPCDFLVLKDRDLDTSRILLPTTGDEPATLGANVARTLRDVAGAEVSLLHVVEDQSKRSAGEQFLADWAVEHGLEDAIRTVDDTGDVEAAISHAAESQTLVLLGASERGLLSRLARDALYLDVIDELDCSVVLAEPETEQGLWRRLFG